ncbi:hypothetical protein R6Q59_002681 [Mikania micrantha]
METLPLFLIGDIFKTSLVLKLGQEINGQADIARKAPIEEVVRLQTVEAEGLLHDLGIQDRFSSRHSPRGIFCSRTLNLRSISALDMSWITF